MRIYLATLVSILTACSISPVRTMAAGSDIKYYFGEVKISSPDGKTPYGKTISLVKRRVDPTKNQITEVVLQPSRNPQQKPKEIITTLTRIGSTDVFSAVDDGRTFDGELTFSGDEWMWNRWTYKIKLVDGSRLEGSGSIDSQGIKTQKTFYKTDGTASVLLTEDLKEVSEQAYNSEQKQLIGL